MLRASLENCLHPFRHMSFARFGAKLLNLKFIQVLPMRTRAQTRDKGNLTSDLEMLKVHIWDWSVGEIRIRFPDASVWRLSQVRTFLYTFVDKLVTIRTCARLVEIVLRSVSMSDLGRWDSTCGNIVVALMSGVPSL